MSFVHHELDEPISAFIKAEFLHQLNEEYRGQLIRCVLFGISSFRGEVPTFRAFLVNHDQAEDPVNGSVYDYVPPHAILLDKERDTVGELELEDLVYHNCMDYAFAVHSVSFLRKRREKEMSVHCYFKRKDRWLAGRYLLSMEWHRGNDLLHLVALENGQLSFLPSHKIKFRDGPRQFSWFGKSNTAWRV